MQIPKDAILLRIFIGESDRWQHQPLFEAIVLKARERHLAGATVLRGPMGFGAASRIHTAKILRLSMDLPMVIEIVDSEEKVNAFLPDLEEMIGGGLVTLEKIKVIHYRTRSRRNRRRHISEHLVRRRDLDGARSRREPYFDLHRNLRRAHRNPRRRRRGKFSSASGARITNGSIFSRCSAAACSRFWPEPRSIRVRSRRICARAHFIGVVSFAVPFAVVWLFAQFVLGLADASGADRWHRAFDHIGSGRLRRHD